MASEASVGMTRVQRYRAAPVETTPPLLEAVDPAPVEARRLTRSLLLDASDLPIALHEGLVTAVSEVVTNAGLHGRPPVTLRGWRRPGEVVVTVEDHGPGPDQGDLGLAPVERDAGHGGFGLWLAGQMVSEVALGRTDGAFVVRLVARADRPGR